MNSNPIVVVVTRAGKGFMNKKTQHTPQIKPAQGRRLQRLLDMEYQPSEIAEETGIPLKTIYRSHIPAGLPVRQDSNGRIWIHGVTYRNWVRAILTTYAEKLREKLEVRLEVRLKANLKVLKLR